MSAVGRQYGEYERDDIDYDEREPAEEQLEEEYEEENRYSVAQMLGGFVDFFRRRFDEDYHGKQELDEEDIEELEEEKRLRQLRKEKKAQKERERQLKREGRSTKAEAEEPEEREERSRRSTVRSSDQRAEGIRTEERREEYNGYTGDDARDFSKKYGVRYNAADDFRRSERKAERRQSIKERMDPGASERKEKRTTSAREWERYKGNVKRLKTVAPKTMNNMDEIASMLMDDYAVIINVSNMRNQLVELVNFLDGVAFVLDYSFDQMSETYYICAPKGYMLRHEFGTYPNTRQR